MPMTLFLHHIDRPFYLSLPCHTEDLATVYFILNSRLRLRPKEV